MTEWESIQLVKHGLFRSACLGHFRLCCECGESALHQVWSTVVEEPEVLIVHLKRFDNKGKKIKQKIKVEE